MQSTSQYFPNKDISNGQLKENVIITFVHSLCLGTCCLLLGHKHQLRKIQNNKHRCAQTRRKDSVTTGDRCSHWLFTLLLTIHPLFTDNCDSSFIPLHGEIISLSLLSDWSACTCVHPDWSVFSTCSLICPSTTTCSLIGQSTQPALWLVHLQLPALWLVHLLLTALWLVSLHNLLSDWSMTKATDSPTDIHYPKPALFGGQ